MAHRSSSRLRKRRRIISFVMMSVCLVGGGFGFVGAIRWFRAQGTSPIVLQNAYAAPVSSETSGDVNVSVSPRTLLRSVESEGSGEAIWEEMGEGERQLLLSATLPDLSQGMTYEAWLVRLAPYDFFSVGTLERQENGSFRLLYSSTEAAHEAYRLVVVTRELPDQNPDPGVHVLEGRFAPL